MTRNKLFIIGTAGLIGVVAIAAMIMLFAAASAKPTQNDFVHFDNQRKVLDKSIESYNYMFDDFSTQYSAAFTEKRSDEHKKQLRDETTDLFKQEAELSRQRLNRMESSLATKDELVKAKFAEFKNNYESALDYYDEQLATATNVIGGIGGSCSELSKLNVAKKSYPQDYVKKADSCLAQLSDTKKLSNHKPAVTLLTNVENLVQERRDKMNEIKGDDFASIAAKIQGLLLLLDINPLVEQYQTQYTADVKADYNILAAKVNGSVTELERATKQQISTPDSNTNGKEQ